MKNVLSGKHKTRIVIASILKPVNDTRMFGKLGASLALDDENEIIVLGSAADTGRSGHRVRFVKHSPFGRWSLRRLIAPWRIAGKLRRLQPDLIIVTTHELLWAAVARKIAANAAVVYDVQENYYLNILHTNAFPPLVRHIVATWVRWKESLAARFVDLFILAERCYATELPFAHARSVVIENKAVLPSGFVRQPPAGKIRLLFSGTLHESTGVFDAIDLVKRLHEADQHIELMIVGYAPHEETRKKIENAVRDSPYIHVKGLHTFVDHSEIIDAISGAHVGIISYPNLPHIANRTGTKVYEYLAAGLPIAASEHLSLLAVAPPDYPLIKVDFTQIDATRILHELRAIPTPAPVPFARWSSETARLQHTINHLTLR